jgi:hypothetical protein
MPDVWSDCTPSEERAPKGRVARYHLGCIFGICGAKPVKNVESQELLTGVDFLDNLYVLYVSSLKVHYL